MTRRNFLASAGVAAGVVGRAAAVPARSGMGFSPDCFVLAKPGRSVKFIEYLQYSYDHGAGGAPGGDRRGGGESAQTAGAAGAGRQPRGVCERAGVGRRPVPHALA